MQLAPACLLSFYSEIANKARQRDPFFVALRSTTNGRLLAALGIHHERSSQTYRILAVPMGANLLNRNLPIAWAGSNRSCSYSFSPFLPSWHRYFEATEP